MQLLDVLFTSVGLSMDASAVGMSNGLAEAEMKTPKVLLIALFYGVFQGIMPLIGYFASSLFADVVASVAPYVALILLGFIGGKMIFEAFKKSDEEHKPLSIPALLVQAVATSIDALAVGVSLLALESAGELALNVFVCCGIFAAVTFAISVASVYIGKKFGTLLADKAELIGGIILVIIGIKIFVEGVFF